MVDDRTTTLHATRAKSTDSRMARRGSTDGAGSDHQPLLDEPVADQLVTLADLAEHLLGAELDVV